MPPQPTLREEALLQGHATRIVYGCGFASKLSQVVDDSQLILVGEAREVGTHLGAHDNSVWTDYDFTVSEAIKCDFVSGQVITVAKAGGQVEIGGAVAEERVNSASLSTASRYVLFLNPSRFGEPRTYWITGADKGTYLITDQNNIKCRDDQAVIGAPCDQPLPDFISAVQNLVAALKDNH
jgi:hypothetical protein